MSTTMSATLDEQITAATRRTKERALAQTAARRGLLELDLAGCPDGEEVVVPDWRTKCPWDAARRAYVCP